MCRLIISVLDSKGKLRTKIKAQKKKEEREKKSTAKTQGDELKDNLADNDDSSSTTTETSNPDVETSIKEVHRDEAAIVHEILSTASALNMHRFFQEPIKKKGRTVAPEKMKEETSNFLLKPKTKKQGATKKENQAEKSRFAF